MAVVNNVKAVQRMLEKQRKKIGKGTSTVVGVGYTANYALYVHENLEMNHPNGGQAKFLTDAAKAFEPDIPRHLETAMDGGMTLRQALVTAGLRIQGDSQKLVPIDTGNLRGSAFTRIIRG